HQRRRTTLSQFMASQPQPMSPFMRAFAPPLTANDLSACAYLSIEFCNRVSEGICSGSIVSGQIFHKGTFVQSPDFLTLSA
ncbi:MAG: hypothetical protein M3Y41_10620, partial [Pseudomonadota bacterium]|nr:hypothetical protein [Pseudomonadota bacterium]